jgi:hypothetical protein
MLRGCSLLIQICSLSMQMSLKLLYLHHEGSFFTQCAFMIKQRSSHQYFEYAQCNSPHILNPQIATLGISMMSLKQEKSGQIGNQPI